VLVGELDDQVDDGVVVDQPATVRMDTTVAGTVGTPIAIMAWTSMPALNAPTKALVIRP
jgi:hypothetical protein